jgi:hypothetical protein
VSFNSSELGKPTPLLERGAHGGGGDRLAAQDSVLVDKRKAHHLDAALLDLLLDVEDRARIEFHAAFADHGARLRRAASACL